MTKPNSFCENLTPLLASTYTGLFHSASPTFVSSLKTEDFSGDAYYSGHKAELPLATEVVAHLKLIKAFQVLRKEVCRKAKDRRAGEYVWKAFVNHSVRRFVLFVLALRHKYPGVSSGLQQNEDAQFFASIPKNNGLQICLEDLCPPIDILLVWYSLMIHTKVAYDVFARNDYLEFLFHPFPLHQANKCIRDDDFTFHGSQAYKSNFHDLMDDYEECAYDLGRFVPDHVSINIYCPECNQVLVEEKPLCGGFTSGFIDPDFTAEAGTECLCGFSSTINHDTLRVRQFYHDLHSETIMLGIYRLRLNMFKRRTANLAEDDKFFKQLLFSKEKSDIRSVIDRFSLSVSHPHLNSALVFEEYGRSGLIPLTIGRADALEVIPDLATLVLQEEPFLNKINGLNILGLLKHESAVANALKRYTKYWEILSKFDCTLVPTIDIDLVWHTHKLLFHSYYDWLVAKDKRKRLLDASGPADRHHTDANFEETAVFYRQYFHQDYTFCPCRFCSEVRHKANVMVSKHHGLPSELVHTNTVGFTHISRYNAVGKKKEQQKATDLGPKKKVRARKAFWLSTNLGTVGGGFL